MLRYFSHIPTFIIEPIFFPILPNQQKSGKNPKKFTRNLVPLAGLEPARMLLRGILRLMRRVKLGKIKNLQSAKTGHFCTKNTKKAPKTNKNQSIKPLSVFF